MRIEYRTIEGEVIERIIEYGEITVNDIDKLALQYLEKTGREPEAVFLEIKSYWKIQQDMMAQARYSMTSTMHPSGMNMTAFMLSMGPVPIVPVKDAYVPVLVGSYAEFDDNDVHKIFEDIVMKGFDRV